MTADWEQYDFYRLLEVEHDAGPEEITKAHEQLISTLDPDKKPDEQKRATALARIVADAVLDVLSDEESRKTYNSRLEEAQKAASSRSKIESKRAGTLQEEQSLEEDVKLQKAIVRYESAKSALADFYYDRLFDTAKKSTFETVPKEKLMEWLGVERAEAMRKAEQKGRRTSFSIDWQGFVDIQSARKRRIEEMAVLVEELVEKLPLP